VLKAVKNPDRDTDKIIIGHQVHPDPNALLSISEAQNLELIDACISGKQFNL